MLLAMYNGVVQLSLLACKVPTSCPLIHSMPNRSRNPNNTPRPFQQAMICPNKVLSTINMMVSMLDLGSLYPLR